jgi:hypothetical protein
MTINSDIKQKQKEVNRLHEKQWQRQQTIEVIKGLVFLVIFVGSVVTLSWIWGR